MSEIEISDVERKKRDWRSKLDGITRELSNTRHSKNAIEYAIDLMSDHKMELERKMKVLDAERTRMIDERLN